MKYMGNMLVVKDIEQSKKFYHDLLGQEVIADFGANVTLTGGFALQTAESWQTFIHKQANEIGYGNNDAELYFEIDDIDGFIEKLNAYGAEYVHPLQEHSWGQRGIRFYDLDKHIIEVGENMAIVVKRFIDSGLTIQQTAARMGVPIEYVESYLN